MREKAKRILWQMYHWNTRKEKRKGSDISLRKRLTGAFICIILAVINLWKYRNLEDPIQSAIRRLKLAKALYSIYMLQLAMFSTFGSDAWELQQVMNLWTGIIISALILLLAVFLIIRASAGMKKIKIQINISQTILCYFSNKPPL